MELFEQIGEDDYRCTRCGAVNTCEFDSFSSYGGTTEYHEKCLACGAHDSSIDLSAVI